MHVTENAWAFLPGYPGIVDAVMYLTRMPWAPAAVTVSVVCGAGASLVFYRLMRRIHLSAGTSLFAVVLFCVSPVSPLFQLAYAEALYLLLLVTALLLLVERRYAWLFPVITLMAFTRPSGLAFALALAMHVVYRWMRRAADPFPVRERILTVSLTVFSGLAGLAWPVIAGIATGSASAYTDTELAWRAPYIGYTNLLPFASWFQGADWWAAVMLGLPDWVGIAVLLVVVALFVLVQFSAPVRRLGPDLRFWIAAYSVYLFAVFFPQSSTFRLLMPLFPLLGSLALPRSRALPGGPRGRLPRAARWAGSRSAGPWTARTGRRRDPHWCHGAGTSDFRPPGRMTDNEKTSTKGELHGGHEAEDRGRANGGCEGGSAHHRAGTARRWGTTRRLRQRRGSQRTPRRSRQRRDVLLRTRTENGPPRGPVLLSPDVPGVPGVSGPQAVTGSAW